MSPPFRVSIFKYIVCKPLNLNSLAITGSKRDLPLYFLGTVLVIVSFGHGLIEPIWELDHVIHRLIILVSLLLLPKAWDSYTIDTLIAKGKKN